MSRIENHIILGDLEKQKEVTITVDGKQVTAVEGEPRGYFCGIGRCTNCVMTVNGDPNVRTCITPVEEGMVVETQDGLGKWEES